MLVHLPSFIVLSSIGKTELIFALISAYISRLTLIIVTFSSQSPHKPITRVRKYINAKNAGVAAVGVITGALVVTGVTGRTVWNTKKLKKEKTIDILRFVDALEALEIEKPLRPHELNGFHQYFEDLLKDKTEEEKYRYAAAVLQLRQSVWDSPIWGNLRKTAPPTGKPRDWEQEVSILNSLVPDMVAEIAKVKDLRRTEAKQRENLSENPAYTNFLEAFKYMGDQQATMLNLLRKYTTAMSKKEKLALHRAVHDLKLINDAETKLASPGMIWDSITDADESSLARDYVPDYAMENRLIIQFVKAALPDLEKRKREHEAETQTRRKRHERYINLTTALEQDSNFLTFMNSIRKKASFNVNDRSEFYRKISVISHKEKRILRAVSEEYVQPRDMWLINFVFGERQENLESLCGSEQAVQCIRDTLTNAQRILNSSM